MIQHIDRRLSTSPCTERDVGEEEEEVGVMFGKTKKMKNFRQKNTLKHSIIMSLDQIKTVTAKRIKKSLSISQRRLRNQETVGGRGGGQKGLRTQLTGHVFVSEISESHTQKAELRLASTRDIPPRSLWACISQQHTSRAPAARKLRTHQGTFI